MAHFVKIETDNVISQAIVISDDDCNNEEFPASEEIGQQFIKDVLCLDGTWKQTSYDNNFRVRYASVGMFYDAKLDEFIAPATDEA